MILLVVLASILIAAVTIYQYKEQSQDYHRLRLERKEAQLISSINYVLKESSWEIKTENLGIIFNQKIYEIANIHNVAFNLYDLEGKLIKSSKPILFENLFDKKMISKMKKGAYIVNTARGKICNKNDIADALKSGQLSGYAGDVWFPQPAPNDHVWRSMPNHGMTPHTSGTSLSAQARYADGVREILECFFDKKPIRDQYLIVKDGQLAGMGAHSYSKGSATSGSEEAAKYKKK